MCFIDKIKSLTRDTSQRFEIICYITWSPCPFCAEELVAFVKDNPHLSLRIFASRLYVHWRWKYQQGLRHLHASGIPVAVMSLPGGERAQLSGDGRVCGSKREKPLRGVGGEAGPKQGAPAEAQDVMPPGREKEGGAPGPAGCKQAAPLSWDLTAFSSSVSEFEDCWRNFVDHQDRSFQPWPNLDQYSKSIKRRLGKILTVRSCPCCRHLASLPLGLPFPAHRPLLSVLALCPQCPSTPFSFLETPVPPVGAPRLPLPSLAPFS